MESVRTFQTVSRRGVLRSSRRTSPRRGWGWEWARPTIRSGLTVTGAVNNPRPAPMHYGLYPSVEIRNPGTSLLSRPYSPNGVEGRTSRKVGRLRSTCLLLARKRRINHVIDEVVVEPLGLALDALSPKTQPLATL